MRSRARYGPLIASGVFFGVGLGGFLDGIVFHQLLQWHHLLSSVVPPTELVALKYNMVWDGVFHVFTWLACVAGLLFLWRAGQAPSVPWSTRTLVGALALGWGAFNVVEGLIDHQLLGLHHVRPGASELAWDLAFVALGSVLTGAGWLLVRHPPGQATPRGVRSQRAAHASGH